MWLLVLASCLLFFWYFCITRRPPGCPPGPLLRVPVLGHTLSMGQDVPLWELRKRYGDIIHTDALGTDNIMINELNLMEEMFQHPSLSGRIDTRSQFGSDFAEVLRGGNGHHGIISNYGLEWQEQRRFILRHLRDLGFGKMAMEEIIMDECRDVSELFREKAQNEEDVSVSLLFNNNVLNIIWRIISGKRFDLNDEKQQGRLEQMKFIMEEFGPTLRVAVCIALPSSIRNKWSFFKQAKKIFRELYEWFEQEYEGHKATFDPNDKRDLIDAYIQERERVLTENETKSSFYGESGHWNFVNSMFDLFLAGAETTSTTLSFFILYMLHHPEVQHRAQEELDAVVGRSRLPSLTDKDQLPYLEAVISEIHRRATVAPLAVMHSVLEDVKIREYTFSKGTVVAPNLSAVMMDPAHFPDPLKFDPDRFYKDEKYQAHPALIPFGVGKRYCPGMSLAKMELFLFVAALLHQFTFQKSDRGLIDMDDVTLGVTRAPKSFFFRVVARD